MLLSYELSPTDVVAAQSLFWRRRRPLFFWGFTIYGALFLLFGLWDASRGSLAGAVVPLVIGVWALLYFPVLIPRAAKKNWAKTPMMHGPTTFETSPQGMEVANPMTRSFLRWDVVGGVLEGPQVWLVFVGPLNFYTIPVRALGSPDEIARFRAEFGGRGTPAPSRGAPLSSP